MTTTAVSRLSLLCIVVSVLSFGAGLVSEHHATNASEEQNQSVVQDETQRVYEINIYDSTGEREGTLYSHEEPLPFANENAYGCVDFATPTLVHKVYADSLSRGDIVVGEAEIDPDTCCGKRHIIVSDITEEYNKQAEGLKSFDPYTEIRKK